MTRPILQAAGWLVLLVALLAAPGSALAAPGDTVADRVLGQPIFMLNRCNNGGLSARSLCRPMGVAVAPSGRLYVADSGNNRVLSWPAAAGFVNGQPADLVIGQPNFVVGGCNTGGLSAKSLCSPRGVAVDHAGNLYVADTVNNRVLWYRDPSLADAVADLVLGQGGFATAVCNNGGLGSKSLCGPWGVAVDQGDHLYVADDANNRVLWYKSPPLSDVVADLVIGQPSFFLKGCNTGGLNDKGLCRPRGVAVDSTDSLYVADSGNNRVLWYRRPPTLGPVADLVVGQPTFFLNGCNTGGLSAKSLCSPHGVAVDGHDQLHVADTGNQRVLRYWQPPASDTAADRVFGQPNFVSNICNNGGLSAKSLCSPHGVALDGKGNLVIADTSNQRVLGYDTP